MFWRKLILLLIIPLATPQLPANLPPIQYSNAHEEKSMLEKVAHYEHILSNESLLQTLPKEDILEAFDSLSKLIRAGTLYFDPKQAEAIELEELEAKLALFGYLQTRSYPIEKIACNTNVDPPQLRDLVFYNNSPRHFEQCGGPTYCCKKVWHWICRHKKAVIIGAVVVIVVALGWYLISANAGAATEASATAAGAGAGGAAVFEPSKSSADQKDSRQGKSITLEEITQDLNKYAKKAQTTVTAQLKGKLESLPEKKPEAIREAVIDYSKEFFSKVVNEILVPTKEVASHLVHETGREVCDALEFAAVCADFVKDTMDKAIPKAVKGIAKCAMPILATEDTNFFKSLIADCKKSTHETIDAVLDTSIADSFTDDSESILPPELQPQIGIPPWPGSGVGPQALKGSKEGLKALRNLRKGLRGGCATKPFKLPKGNNTIYRFVNQQNSQVQYVGMTNNIARRAREHSRSKGIIIRPVKGLENLTRKDARAVEQTLMEFYGLGKDGGTLVWNKINSISKKNPEKARSLIRGLEILEHINYE